MAELQEVISIEELEETRIFFEFFECKDEEVFNDDSSQSKTQQTVKLARVPKEMRDMESIKECFEPKLVSIGPYHHNNPKLQAAEDFKKKLARKFVQICKCPPRELYSKIFTEIEQIRDLYEKEVMDKYNKEALTRILLVDGCFVLYSIYCLLSFDWEYLNTHSYDFNDVLQDVLLLENQLPFLVLELLLGEDFQEYKKYTMIEMYIENIRDTLMPLFVGRKLFRLDPKNSIHLLQLLQIGLLGTSNNDQLITVSQEFILPSTYSVTDLKAVGIQCKPSQRSDFGYVVFNPYWSTRVLQLPSIIIDKRTRSQFFNMIAYEKHLDVPVSEVQSYIRFLASLIRRPEDVKELQAAHILYNYIGNNEEALKVFKEMADHCSPNLSNKYTSVKMQIGDYLNKRGRIKMALWLDEVISKYFKSPWTVIVAMAGFLVLSATILQTAYTILSYYYRK